MSLDSLMARGRAAAERLMTDTCVVRKVSGQTVDPDTGQHVTTFAEVYTGACKVQTDGGVGGDQSSEIGAVLVEWLQRIDFPWSTTGLTSDMIVEITGSGDPNLVGHRYRLVSPQSAKTYATAVRWNVKEAA